MKACSKCKIEKILDMFPKTGNKCSSCIKEYKKKYDLVNKDNNVSYRKKYKNKDNKRKAIYRSLNKKKLNDYNINYRKNNTDKIKIYSQSYYLNNKSKILSNTNSYNKKKRLIDPSFRLRKNISRSINQMLKNSSAKKFGSCMKFLSYSMQELKDYLEKQFEPWMNWNNQGTYFAEIWDENNYSTWTWQIDHIIPQSKLPYSSMEDDNFKKCWALENLRPLPAKLNLLKGSKLIYFESPCF